MSQPINLKLLKETASSMLAGFDDSYIKSLPEETLRHLSQATQFFMDPKLFLSARESHTSRDLSEIIESESMEQQIQEDEEENLVETDIKSLTTRLETSSLATLRFLKSNEKISLEEGDNAFYNSVVQLPQEYDEFVPVKIPELLLTVSVYQSKSLIHKAQEFVVLGSQRLTELRDKIYCIFDHIFADHPQDDEHAQRSGKKNFPKSSFFYIENTFYDDLRNPTNEEQSRLIRDWINDSTANVMHFGKVGSEKMESTTFDSMVLRTNQPYLFSHQGGCEHVIMFKEVRLFHPSDNQNRLSYPLLTFQSKIRRRKCRVCDIYSAKHVTINDRLAPENPCFYCDQCYYVFHYDQQGRLLYSDYEVFPYLHELS